MVYTLDTDISNGGSTDWENVVAIIPAGEESESEDSVRTFQLTSDANLEENPQITTTEFEDNEERFVVAWHTEWAITKSTNGETESDIHLAVLDKDGVLYGNMPESLRITTGGAGDTVGSNFRFAKNIEDLSILWADTISGEADEQSYDSI